MPKPALGSTGTISNGARDHGRDFLGDRLCDGFVLTFAVWTILCQIVVLTGGNLHRLLIVAALGFAVLLGGWVWASRRRRTRNAPPPAPRTTPEESLPRHEVSQTPKKVLRRLLFVTAVLAVALYAITGNPTAFWLIGLFVLLLASKIGISAKHVDVPAPAPRPSWKVVLYALSTLTVILTLVSHRPDPDDSGYVAMAVSVADHPENPLLARDMVLGLAHAHPLLRVYRAQTLEVLEGTLAYLTGLPALDFAHLWVPAIAAFLVPVAYARLFRLVTPGRWIWGVVVVLLFLLLVANTHRSYGNFAFVRLHQGKAIFLSVLVPLVIAYGLQFARTPSMRHWVRLAASQVASVGLTVSALWMAPLVAGVAVACGVPDRRRALRTLLLGASASGYVLLLGSWIRQQIVGTVDSSTSEASGNLMVHSMEFVLGNNEIAILILLVVVAGWVAAQTPVQSRFLTFFPLCLFALWSPYWGRWVAENLTHPWLYWRIFWVLPVPALLAVALTAPIELRGLRWVPVWLRIVSSLVAATAIFYWGSGVPTLSSANGVRLGAPTWKVPKNAFSAACAITELAPAGAYVLAPPEVETWIPALHDHPTPLVARDHYLAEMGPYLGAEEIERRRQLSRLVSIGPVSPNAGQLIRGAVESYPLAVVCLSDRTTSPEIGRALQEAGLQKTAKAPSYEIWSRPEARQDGEHPGSTRCPAMFSLP